MKLVYTTFLSFVSLMTLSQVSLKKLDGTVINDGDILTYSSLSEPGNYLGLKIYNSSAADISVKVKVVSITNATGSNVQLCVNPVCVNTLIVGNSYPAFGSIIPANGVNGNFDHFKNETLGIDPTLASDYVLKLFIIDENDVEIGNSITFTYRFTPTLSNTEFDSLQAVGVKITNTLVYSTLKFNSTSVVNTTINDLNGKLLLENNYTAGSNTIDLSSLSSGIYVINYKNQEGKNASVKFIKK